MTTRERMQSGKLYFCTDEEIAKEQLECLEILYDYNHTRPSESQKREQILKNLLAEIGENCYIEPPLHANWGKYTHFGPCTVTGEESMCSWGIWSMRIST